MAEEKKQEEQTELTQTEVLDVLKFAENLYSPLMYGNGVWTPQLVSSALKSNTMTPEAAGDPQTIESALSHPNDTEDKLLGYSEYFELTSSVYKRALTYYSSLLSFDVSFDCVNAKPGDYSSKRFIDDFNNVGIFLDKFDVKAEFSKIARQLMRQGIYVGLWRNDCDDKFLFQEFPSTPNYALLTGRWAYGYTVDLNMLYFLRPGVDIDMYPDQFKEYYRTAFGDQVDHPYIPSNSTIDRTGAFAQWVQTDPMLVWAFKSNPEVATRVPFLSGMLADVSLQPVMRQLQSNANIGAASKIVAGQVGIKRDSKGAIVQDALTLNPVTLGKFLSVVKAGLSDVIQLVAAPLENIKGIEFDGSETKELYSTYQKNAAALAGNSNFFFSDGNSKMNAIETQLIANIDENITGTLYPQFEDFLNFAANQYTGKYKFKFHLNGYNNYLYRKEIKERCLSFIPVGFLDLDTISHAMGMNNKTQLIRKMNETKGFDLSGLITILPTSGKSLDGSLPEVKKSDETDVSENGREIDGDADAREGQHDSTNR